MITLYQLQTIYNNLLGDWVFNRNILNSDLRIHATAFGKATFVPCQNKNTLEYQEFGQVFLIATQTTSEFSRKYTYLFTEVSLEIYFAEGMSKGNLFHRLFFGNNNNKLTSQAKHLCVNDIYEGYYDFNEPYNFCTNYKVTGPSKNYSISTNYNKNNLKKP